MKTRLLVTTGLLLIAATATASQWDPNPDGIGVYFDQGGYDCPYPYATPYTPLTAYLMGTRLTHGGCSGWEATLLINPTSFPAGITLDVGSGALNVLTAPDFQVGLSPARMGTQVVLLTITTFYLSGQILFGVGPCVPSSFGGLCPGYADPVDPGVLVPMTAHGPGGVAWTLPIFLGANTDLPPNGPANSYAVAGVNIPPGCPYAAEASTWGGVKSLYGR